LHSGTQLTSGEYAQFGAGEHSAPLISISTAAPSAPSAARAFRVTAKTFHTVSLQWELPEDSGGRYKYTESVLTFILAHERVLLNNISFVQLLGTDA
jgi:hypothetical protein